MNEIDEKDPILTQEVQDGCSSPEVHSEKTEDNNNPKKKSRLGLGMFLGILIGIAASAIAVVIITACYYGKSAAGDYVTKIETILSYLNERYLFEMPDNQGIADATASGLLSGIGDKYAQYYTAKEFEALIEETSGNYAGIGVSVFMNENNEVEVYKVFNGTPAKESGIQVKDIIIEANGVTYFETLDDLVDEVRGEEGTSVHLTIRRGDQKIEMDCMRARIDIESVNYEMLENGVGYLSIDQFDQATVNQFKTAVDALEAQNMRALIIDVRDNPGGDYSSVVAISDRVLPAGTIITTEDKYGNVVTETSDEENQIRVPMCVLCNGNSASAAELFTGALQDYGVATIIGTQTFGKGIVQSLYKLPDGSGMKFTTEKYFTPLHRDINGVGITPDEVVEIPDEAYEDGEVTKEEDTQLQKALEILK